MIKQPPLEKPFLRGYFHQAMFYFALGVFTILLCEASSKKIFLCGLVYALSICGLYGVSALYHRVHWSLRKRAFMRKMDHAFIFIFIAGTATPICLLALEPHMGRHILIVLWITVFAGVLQSIFWPKAPKWVAAILYVLAGWQIAPYLGNFYDVLGFRNASLIVAGGLVYTLGALVYALKFPNPRPKYFGYHEIFHIFVIIGTVLHFLVVMQLLI